MFLESCFAVRNSIQQSSLTIFQQGAITTIGVQ